MANPQIRNAKKAASKYISRSIKMTEQAWCSFCGRLIPKRIKIPEIPFVYHAVEDENGQKVSERNSWWAKSNYGKVVQHQAPLVLRT